MTSKSLFFKLMKEDLKRRIWSIALSILVCFLSYPVVIGIVLSNYNDSTASLNTIMKSIFQITGPRYTMGYLIAGMGALICGLNSFYYLHSKKKVDLYHSIPVRREAMFAVNYINGFIIYFIPYITNIILGWLVIGLNGYFTQRLLINGIATILIHSVFFLLFYTLVIIAVLLTGNLVVSMLGTGVFFLYGFYLAFIQGSYFSKFFRTYYELSQIKNPFLRLSPFHSYRNVINQYLGDLYLFNQDTLQTVLSDSINIKSVGFSLIKVFCLTLAFIAFALYLYKRRPSEAAGNAMSFQISKPIIKYLLVVPTSLAGGIIFDSLSNNRTDGWFIFGLVFFFFLSYALIEIIYNFDMKSAFKGRVHMALSGITVFIIVLIFYKDLLGFNSYLPEKKDIKAMAVNVEGLDSYIWYGYGNSYKMEQMEITNYNELYELAKEGIKELKNSSDKDSNNPSDTLSILLKYSLNNGKTVYRKYSIDRDMVYKQMNKVYEEREFKLNHFPIFTWTANTVKDIIIATPYEARDLRLSEDAKREFLENYKNELEALTLQEVKEAKILATLFFNLNDGYEHSYMIYSSFTKTKAFLESYGFHLNTGIRAEDIKDITVMTYGDYQEIVPHTQKVDREVGVAIAENTEKPSTIDNSITKTYVDRETIEALLPHIIERSYYYENRSFVLIDQDYEVIVRYVMDDLGNTNEEVFSFKKGEVPEFVLKDLGK